MPTNLLELQTRQNGEAADPSSLPEHEIPLSDRKTQGQLAITSWKALTGKTLRARSFCKPSLCSAADRIQYAVHERFQSRTFLRVPRQLR